MTDFTGAGLKVFLHGGFTVTGIMKSLDMTTRNLILESATVYPLNSPPVYEECLVISGSKIADLEIVQAPAPKAQPPTLPPPLVSQAVPEPARPSQPARKPREPSKPATFIDPAIVSIGSPAPEKVPERVADTPTTTAASSINAVSSPPLPAALNVNKPNELPPKSTTTPSKPEQRPKGLLFGNKQSAKLRKPIIETEILDYRELYGKKVNKRIVVNETEPVVEQPKQKPGVLEEVVILQKPKPENDNTQQTESSANAKASPLAVTAETSAVPSPPPAAPAVDVNGNGTVNKEATASLNSLLHIQTLQKPSQSDLNVPRNLIPPKARAHANGAAKTMSPPSSISQEQHSQSPQLLSQPKPQVFSSPQPKPQAPVQPIEETLAGDEDMPFIKTAAHGIRCPVVTPAQMQKVEDICMTETGPNREMMIENAGHGASIMALKALGGERRIQPDNHNAAPVVVVLAGNNKTGSYSLASARHLANRGCRVYIVLTSRPDAPLNPAVELQKNYAVFAGVTVVKNVQDLPEPQTSPVDLIIDAMMGIEFSAKALRDDYKTRELLWAAMDWANGNKAPVLSLDFPSGINATDGHPFHVMHHIHPKWTLCFGAPKQGCTSRSITGELFLADIGIPAVSWREASISRCKIPWGAEFILALEYAI